MRAEINRASWLTVVAMTVLVSLTLASCRSVEGHATGIDARLLRAFEQRDAEGVRSCLAQGACPRIRDRHGWPLLIAAAYDGRSETVDMLLAAGVDPNETYLHLTPLRVGYPYPSIVASLIRSGADVNQAFGGEMRWTVLMSASIGGYRDSVLALVQGGANVNAVNERGLTAADLAEKEGHQDIARFLRNEMERQLSSGAVL